jgi:hypothetical protein
VEWDADASPSADRFSSDFNALLDLQAKHKARALDPLIKRNRVFQRRQATPVLVGKRSDVFHSRDFAMRTSRPLWPLLRQRYDAVQQLKLVTN